MAATWVRALVALIAFAVVLVLGINMAGAIDLTPDPNTGVPVGFNTIVTILAIGLLVALVAYAGDGVRANTTVRLDHLAVRHANDRPDPDRDRDQHHPRPDGVGGPEGSGLPRLDRDDPRRRPRRPDRWRRDRRPCQPDLDLRAAGTVPVAVRGALLHRGRRDRAAGRSLRPAGLLPEPSEHARASQLAVGRGRGRGRRRDHRDLRVPALLHQHDDEPARAPVLRPRSSWHDRSRPDLRDPRLGRRAAPDRVGTRAHRPARSIRRDLGAAYVFVAGLLCGIVSAIISAPIAAIVFSGVTGSGTDLLVAAFQKAGDELGTAVLKQGLLSDPIDKTVTFFVVFAILGALSRRFVARFPQGESAIGLARPSRSTRAAREAAPSSSRMRRSWRCPRTTPRSSRGSLRRHHRPTTG